MTETPQTTAALRSVVTPDRTVEVTIEQVDVPAPGPDDVVVRLEAAAVNPSDLGMLFASADLGQAQRADRDGRPVLVAPLSQVAADQVAARLGQSMPAGNEGAGTVIAAGESASAQALLGQVVGVIGGGMYAGHRCLPAADCQPFPDGTSAEDGAGWFINPMTASAMLATARDEGHTAIVHTAAASRLGRMLIRLCAADGVPLVNVVRRPEQVQELTALGAECVCDSSADDFHDALVEAVAATGATIGFDAVGGGGLVHDILAAMEAALSRGRPFDRYGSPVHKQVYLYGSLAPGATELRRTYGMSWGVGGWLVMRRLALLGPDATAQLRARVAAEITTTFATEFTGRLSLEDALDVETARDYGRATTNRKSLIAPND